MLSVYTDKATGRRATHGSAAVSKVDRPIPTTNIEPQKPPKLSLMADGQKSRQPTARTARPSMKVTRKP